MPRDSETAFDDIPPDPGASWATGSKARREKTQRANGKAKEEGPGRGLPVIKLFGGSLPFSVDEAERILIGRDPEVFQRGDFIVRPAREMIAISDQRQTRGLRLVPIKTQHLIERLTRIIDFQRFDARSKKWVSINCPPDVAAAYLERVGNWNLLPLTGIVNAPTLRPDGSILDRQGYDTATGILYAPSETYPPIPWQLSKDHARAALNELTGLIAEFPFVGADGEDAKGKKSPSRSVALSAILTAMIRRSIPHAPLHAFTAPVMGSGKSKLVDVASLIATGHEAPVISQGRTEEEMEKRLGAALIAGDTLISFDNCEQPLGGELLCQALTQPVLKIRILGKSVIVAVPSNAMFAATGNNLIVAGDMVRRTIVGTLDPKVERPETRTFQADDPILIIRRDRARYVAAALVVLRAYVVAGLPEQDAKPLGSFEGWSRMVRDALLWLGEDDPCMTMERARAEDPYTQALSEVLMQWQVAVGMVDVTVKRAIDIAEEKTAAENKDAFDYPPPVLKNPEFRDALLAVAADRGISSSLRLGKWLAKNKGRVVGGLRIDPGLNAAHGGVVRWKLSEAKPADPCAPRF